MKWAHHYLKELREAIANIERTVTVLRDIITLRSPQEPQKLLREPKIEQRLENQTIRKLYSNLHQTLREANRRSKRPVTFTISVLGDLEANWNLLDDSTALPLRRGSVAFWLQMHDSLEASNFLMAEVQLEAETTTFGTPDLKPIDFLDVLPERVQNGPALDYFEWGSLRPKYAVDDRVHLFLHGASWRKTRTLHEVLAEKTLNSRLKNTEIIELCQNILTAHSNLAEVRISRSNTRLESYVFYECQDEQNPETHGELDVRNPYLDFGFGRQLDGRKPGVSHSSFKHSDGSIIELGLVLFQLVTRTVFVYAASNGSTRLDRSMVDAKNRALQVLRLHDIDDQFGPVMSPIVESCLTGDS